jgi:protein TonB
MFEQSLVEISSEMKKRKRWTALVSYSIEALAVGIVLSFPLVHTEALPLDDRPTFHPPTHYVPDHVQITTTTAVPPPTRRQQVMINPYFAPQSIPKGIDPSPDPTPPVSSADGLTIPGSIPGELGERGPQNPVLESLLRPTVANPLHHASLAVRSSKSQESLLIRQIKPTYPPLAQQTRVQGSVVLQAMIAHDGSIQQLQVLSGHPLLVKAAVDAVKQWRYRPYSLNGEAVEVETQITVNFTLNGN